MYCIVWFTDIGTLAYTQYTHAHMHARNGESSKSTWSHIRSGMSNQAESSTTSMIADNTRIHTATVVHLCCFATRYFSSDFADCEWKKISTQLNWWLADGFFDSNVLLLELTLSREWTTVAFFIHSLHTLAALFSIRFSFSISFENIFFSHLISFCVPVRKYDPVQLIYSFTIVWMCQ